LLQQSGFHVSGAQFGHNVLGAGVVARGVSGASFVQESDGGAGGNRVHAVGRTTGVTLEQVHGLAGGRSGATVDGLGQAGRRSQRAGEHKRVSASRLVLQRGDGSGAIGGENTLDDGSQGR
ncbi:hypothetical protein CSC81_19020, partial [Tenacibaculum discolor]